MVRVEPEYLLSGSNNSYWVQGDRRDDARNERIRKVIDFRQHNFSITLHLFDLHQCLKINCRPQAVPNDVRHYSSPEAANALLRVNL